MNDSYDHYGYGGSYYDSYVDEQLKEARKTFSTAALALFIYLLVSNIAVIAGQLLMIILFGRDEATRLLSESVYLVYIFNFVSQYVIAFPALCLVLRSRRPMRVEKERLSGKDFIVFFLISQAVMQAGAIIGEVLNATIGGILGGEITNDVSDMIAETPIWLVILFVVVIGPIFEELIFRKLIFDRVARFGTWTAIITTSIAFGLFHGNLYQLFYAAGLGVVLGFLYAKTRNVLYPIAMHMLINLFGTVPSLLLGDSLVRVYEAMEKFMSDYTFDITPYYLDLLAVGAYSFFSNALIIGGVIMFIVYLHQKSFTLPEKCEFKLPRERAFSTVVSNVGAVLFLILIALTIILNLIPAA